MASTNTNAPAVTDSGTLTVTGIPPKITLPPTEEMTVAEGVDVEIHCNVEGLPTPWHTWLNVSDFITLHFREKKIVQKDFLFHKKNERKR